MTDSINDGSTTESEFTKYIPKRHREQQSPGDSERPPYVLPASTAPWPAEGQRGRRLSSDLWPEPVPDFPLQRGDGLFAQIVRLAMVGGAAGAVALLVVFGKPLLDDMRPLFGSVASTTGPISKSADPVE